MRLLRWLRLAPVTTLVFIGVLSGVLVLLSGGLAYAVFTQSGGGTGTARTATTEPVVLSPGTPTASLFPGGTGTVVTRATNPNPFPVRVSSLGLDTSQATGGFAVDAGPSGCTLDTFGFTAQDNGGVGWTVPASGSLDITLPSSLSATAATANACQGATLTVYLRAATVGQPTSYAAMVAATPGLLHWYRLDQTSGTTVVDTQGTNSGTWGGGPTFGTAGAVPGNTAVTFDGVDDHGSITRTISTTFSIEFWLRSTQGRGTGSNWWNMAGLVDGETPAAFGDFGVGLAADGRILAGVNDDPNVISPAGYNDGSWHHVVFTRNGTTGALQLFVDGELRSSQTAATGALTASANLRFGSLQDARNYFAGSLDEIALYDVVLPATTVSAHYQARNL